MNEVGVALLIVAALFTVSGSAAAQAETQVISLTDALERSPDLNAEVILAQADLAAAERELRRTEGDPLALRLPLLEARQRVASERTDLTSARLEAEQAASSRFFGALEADDALDLARTRRDIAEVTVQAAQIRFDSGQIGQLELTRVNNDLEAAEREVASAEQRRTLAYGEVASVLGLEVEGLQLLAPFAPPQIPELDKVLGRLGENTLLQRAAQTVALARLRLELSDASYSPQRDIEMAEDALASAETQRRELRRSLDLSVRGAYNAALAARDAFQNAQVALQSAEDEFAAQRLRFDAGEVSRLALAEGERNVAERAANLRSAQYALSRTVTQLDLAVRGAQSTGSIDMGSEVEGEDESQ